MHRFLGRVGNQIIEGNEGNNYPHIPSPSALSLVKFSLDFSGQILTKSEVILELSLQT